MWTFSKSHVIYASTLVLVIRYVTMNPSVFYLGIEICWFLNKFRWDDRSSVVTPNEDVFYLVALLRSALDNGEETLTLKHLSDENRKILKFCKESQINAKQYLPHYRTQEDWMEHYGDKWPQIYQRKMEFDPRRILATGQKIFEPSFASDIRSW